jgi:hypothetical protein
MLLIRKKHKDTFGKIAKDRFECRALAHCKRVFKPDCEKLGDPAVKERIRKGIDAAGGYGVRKEYDVVRYIDLMFILSEDYDTNRSFPWAARILTSEDLGGTTKMDRLCERTEKELVMLRKKHGA